MVSKCYQLLKSKKPQLSVSYQVVNMVSTKKILIDIVSLTLDLHRSKIVSCYFSEHLHFENSPMSNVIL